jgi:hypothetical protein
MSDHKKPHAKKDQKRRRRSRQKLRQYRLDLRKPGRHHEKQLRQQMKKISAEMAQPWDVEAQHTKKRTKKRHKIPKHLRGLVPLWNTLEGMENQQRLPH